MPDRPAAAADVDHRLAFEQAPVGLVVSRQRVIVDCNHAVAEIFRTSRDLLLGQSFLVLYPSPAEFERTGERIAPILGRGGRYADDRIMKRSPDDPHGELFWCHVSGHALHRDRPHAEGIWSFEDLSSRRRVTTALTGREREVAALIGEGRTSKQIGRSLGLSHRTVDVYRARLLRKYGAATTAELVHKLVGT